jgi:hypothetical protein
MNHCYVNTSGYVDTKDVSKAIFYSGIGTLKRNTLREYQRTEQSKLIVTHCQFYNGMWCYWLKTFGLTSWQFEIKYKLNIDVPHIF